ncbi:MAG: cytochrome c oxidase accessory protein CcoG [Rhodospirillales bacterium]|nr:cytochrome c oxidase accessory protein CcoG [Rhodospirillales bacterium]
MARQAALKIKPPEPEESGEQLYADYVKVHPRKVSGTFRTLKWATLSVLLGLYYIAPFLRWDRGPGAPDQAILIDMPGRRAYFFAVEIWPQEVYYLTGLLIIGAVGLFLVTALLGRVWCGYACPQTVWTDLFVWVESLFEGDRNARIRLDRQPWTAGKVLRKIGKHAVWLLVSLLTGGAWILYFNDVRIVIPELFQGTAGAGVYGFLFLFTATTYVLAGWAREQVCIYMCPWPRFQAAMFDEDTLMVTYEAWRGEPRGSAKVGQSFEGRGHCIDCRMCVQVCPTGIDIREGSQLACIGCALCVDACNGIMDKMGLPRDLITWDSINNQAAREHGNKTGYRFIRPRTVVYALILMLVAGLMGYGLVARTTTGLNVLHERSPLFVTMSDGSIRNGYTVKVLNMVRENRDYRLQIAGIPEAAMSVVGLENTGRDQTLLPVPGDSVGTFQVYVSAGPERLDGKSTELVFVLIDMATGNTIENATMFAGPGS